MEGFNKCDAKNNNLAMHCGKHKMNGIHPREESIAFDSTGFSHEPAYMTKLIADEPANTGSKALMRLAPTVSTSCLGSLATDLVTMWRISMP